MCKHCKKVYPATRKNTDTSSLSRIFENAISVPCLLQPIVTFVTRVSKRSTKTTHVREKGHFFFVIFLCNGNSVVTLFQFSKYWSIFLREFVMLLRMSYQKNYPFLLFCFAQYRNSIQVAQSTALMLRNVNICESEDVTVFLRVGLNHKNYPEGIVGIKLHMGQAGVSSAS